MAKGIWIYDADHSQFNYLDDYPTFKIVNQCMQQILLWTNENPMNISDGIDYIGVREQRVFLKSSIESITDQYLYLFDSIVISDLQYSDDGQQVIVDITFTKQDESMTVQVASNI